MKKQIILIIFIIILAIKGECGENKKIIYNSEKGYYELWDTRLNKLMRIIRNNSYNNSSYNISKVKIAYPYQEGFPALMPYGMYESFNICDVNNDNKKELFVNPEYSYLHMLNYLGEEQDWGEMYAYIATCGYIDNDKNLDIIGFNNGVVVRRYDGSMIEGFPYFRKLDFYSSSIEDIDRDGNNEIALAPLWAEEGDNYMGLYVFGSWGGLLPGFPTIFPPAYPNGASGYNVSNPSVGDFDDDGYLEIAVTDGRAFLNIIRYNGSKFRNWPVGFPAVSVLNDNIPAMADIDNDEKLEIIVSDYNKLFGFNEDASMLDGFPINLDALPGSVQSSYESPAIGDVDQDGNLEIFIAVMEGIIYGFRNTGEKIPAWPINVEKDISDPSFYNNAIIGDIDGDGEMEILAGGTGCDWPACGFLVAYNLDGTLVPGFPITEEHYKFFSAPYLTDLDNDGDIEICTTSVWHNSLPAYVYCYDLPYPYDKTKISWGSYSHDYNHTARYVDPKVNPPHILSISPNSDSFRGGRIVEIRGKYFIPGEKVFFDGIPSEYVQVVDSTTIYAKVPPHKPCQMFINDPSISPYELSELLLNQPVINESSIYIGNLSNSNENSLDGCIVNIVVAHPTPDQREGVLKGAFKYTGYEQVKDNIILYLSKYSASGTFENQAANWRIISWYNKKSLWNILDDSSDCIPKPYPSGHKVAYYGNKSICNYNTPGEKNDGFIVSPVVRVDTPDAKLRFKYYRDVEYNPAKYPMRKVDKFEVSISYGMPVPNYTIWEIDSSVPSVDKWLEAEIPIGQWVGKDLFISFVFNTVDEEDNSHRGIAVDDVELIGAHWEPWSDDSGEVHLQWTGGLPKYFVYRGTSPNFIANPPELRAYTPFNHIYENSLNDYMSYYYKVR